MFDLYVPIVDVEIETPTPENTAVLKVTECILFTGALSGFLIRDLNKVMKAVLFVGAGLIIYLCASPAILNLPIVVLTLVLALTYNHRTTAVDKKSHQVRKLRMLVGLHVEING